MITIELLDARYIELTDELRRVEGSARENRRMREWLAVEQAKAKEVVTKKKK